MSDVFFNQHLLILSRNCASPVLLQEQAQHLADLLQDDFFDLLMSISTLSSMLTTRHGPMVGSTAPHIIFYVPSPGKSMYVFLVAAATYSCALKVKMISPSRFFPAQCQCARSSMFKCLASKQTKQTLRRLVFDFACFSRTGTP